MSRQYPVVEERIKMVKAMEFIARHINDEDVFFGWLEEGVADGDIKYGDLDASARDYSDLEDYIENETFSELMRNFLDIMVCAKQSGGLWCDSIVSKRKRHYDEAKEAV